jgi:23S rRNA pseudouridine1911/1915/1917 synthase
MSDVRPPPPPPRRGGDRAVEVPASARGERLDRFLATVFPGHSRRRVNAVLRAGLVRVGGRTGRPGTMLAGGEILFVPPLDAAVEQTTTRAHAGTGTREVEVIHRDEDLLVVSKPPGVPCHGGAGLGVRRTLLERLKDDVMAGFGLVHRIDQDTSGLVVLARGDLKRLLGAAFGAPGTDDAAAAGTGDDGPATEPVAGGPGKAVEKVYDALVEGCPDPMEGTIDLPLADPGHGTRARVDRDGRPSRTEYRVVECLGTATRVRAIPRTGRTHQIRVHLAAIGTPLLVDPLYGRRSGWRMVDPKGGTAARLARTPLHAAELTFVDPRTGERRTFRAPLLADHRRALEVLRVVAARSAGPARASAPPTATRVDDAPDADGEPTGPSGSRSSR